VYILPVSLLIRFLGTSASRPTVERAVSSVALVREGETMLFDCGEGTQRQMMRYGVSFSLGDIFITHFHADHFLGLPGLLRTMSLQARTEVLRVWGPRGAERMVRRAESLGGERLAFDVEICELAPGATIDRGAYEIAAFPVDHRGSASLGFALVEHERRGRFNPELARSLGIPEGPLWGKLHRGMTVTLEDGRTIDPSAFVGPVRSGRRIVVTGDTRPCEATIEAAKGAQLLVHEATFADEEAERARETGHSTSREAAHVARAAGVERLALTHLSARYSRDAGDLLREAAEVFPNVLVAKDGTEIEVPDSEQIT
jgi:ribonuclease Z